MVARGLRQGEWGLFKGYGVLFGGHENDLELDRGDGCATL